MAPDGCFTDSDPLGINCNGSFEEALTTRFDFVLITNNAPIRGAGYRSSVVDVVAANQFAVTHFRA